jgi:menaquinone-dependent protoporphyrinogen IX oxidase
MGDATTGALIGAGTSILGMIGANTRRKQQMADQQKLMGIQQKNQMELNKQGQQLAQENWDYTNAENQVKHYENAGLNVGMMYGGSGAGGQLSSGSGGGASGGNAPIGESVSNIMGLGLQAQQIQSAIELNKAMANKANAEAENTGANTTTTNATRDYLVENMRQSGISQWAENLKKKMELDPDTYNNGDENVVGSTIYKDQIRINENSYVLKQLNQDLLKAAAETKNLDASTALTNEKVKGYWQELLNATSQANSQAIQAAAQKLSAEFNTGEFTNWKTWTDLGTDAIKALGSLSGFIKPKNLPKVK